MKALLISLVIIGLVGAAVGGGLFAMFSDTETSEGNTFASGNLDLKMWNSVDEVEADGNRSPDNALMFAFEKMKPTDVVVVPVSFKNAGDIAGSLSVVFSAVDPDGLGAELYVTGATYDSTPILSALKTAYDANSNGILTIAELAAATAPPFADASYAAGEQKDLALTVTFNALATGPMGATCTIDITATLTQS